MKIFFVILFSVIFVTGIQSSFGHGVSYDLIQTETRNNEGFTLGLASSHSKELENHREVSFHLFESNSKETVPEVTFEITVLKEDKVIHNGKYQSDDGFLTLNFDLVSEKLFLKEEKNLEKLKQINPYPKYGGLYIFDVKVLTAGSFNERLEIPLKFEAGLSFPSSTFQEIDVPGYGKQNIGIVGYYDKVSNLEYDPSDKSINFQMNFDWPKHSQDELFFIHNEFLIPKTFGEFRVKNYTAQVNGVDHSSSLYSIDHFLDENLRVHLVTDGPLLAELSEKLENSKPKNLEFSLKPKNPEQVYNALTPGGRYEINLWLEPEKINPDSNVVFNFIFNDIFSFEKKDTVDYDLVISSNERILFEESTSSIVGENNELKFQVPQDIQDPLLLQFKNLNGIVFSEISFPIPVNLVSENISIPQWIKNNAEWYSTNKISEQDFILGIQHLVDKEILIVPTKASSDSNLISDIPEWIKNTAGWWAEGKVSDSEFISAIQFLIDKKIVLV